MSDLYEYIDRRVKINYTDKGGYKIQGVVGLYGTVQKVSGGTLGVLVDGKRNKASAYGLYWFEKSNLKILKNESEDIVMEGYKNVAIVNLIEDCNKKDYAFALYDEDLNLICDIERENSPAMVVVNARGKNHRVLGTIKEIMPLNVYKGSLPTAEVVGVVNMNNYIAREMEKERQAELAEKRAAIEAELEKEINKRKSVEYYEEMAQKYADNPRLAELVGELRGLGA